MPPRVVSFIAILWRTLQTIMESLALRGIGILGLLGDTSWRVNVGKLVCFESLIRFGSECSGQVIHTEIVRIWSILISDISGDSSGNLSGILDNLF